MINTSGNLYKYTKICTTTLSHPAPNRPLNLSPAVPAAAKTDLQTPSGWPHLPQNQPLKLLLIQLLMETNGNKF